MPRYFFDVRDESFIPDDTGLELPDLQAAKVQAVAFAGRMLAEDPDKFLDGDEWLIEIRHEDGLVLYSFAFYGLEAAAAMRARQG